MRCLTTLRATCLPALLSLVLAGAALAPGGTQEQTKVSKYDAMPQLLVPAGEFNMGAEDADALGRQCEFPPHRVRLSAYWIDKFEVTNAQFVQFLNQTVAGDRGTVYSYCDLGNPFCRIRYDSATKQCSVAKGYEQHPVCAVSRVGAEAYARRVHRRLPTEAEWEKAARGTDQRRYPWGNQWDSKNLVTREDGAAEPQPVGSRPADRSPYGALDMAGNVSEWVADAWDEHYYLSSPPDNPVNLEGGWLYVVRGGAWCLTEWDARTTSRRLLGAGVQRRYMGFRCAETVPEPLPAPLPVSESVLFYAPMDGYVYAAAARGERRPAQVSAALTFVPGHRGQAALLGDADNVLRSVAYEAAENFRPEEGTLALWIQPQGWTGTDSGFRYFFMIMDEATCKFYLYRYQEENLLVIAGNGIENEWGTVGMSTREWKEGQWLHLAVTWKDRKVTLYVDGKRVGETLVPADKYFRGLPGRFSLGQSANWAPTQKHASTAFDEFVIFSRALGPEEIVRERDRQGPP